MRLSKFSILSVIQQFEIRQSLSEIGHFNELKTNHVLIYTFEEKVGFLPFLTVFPHVLLNVL